VGTTTSATVSWTNVPVGSNGGSAITGYQVSVNGGGFSALTNGGTVSGLGVGSNSIQVRAVNGVGPGPAASTSVTITAAPPGAPGGLVVSNNGSTINVSWQPPASGTAPTGYTVRLLQGATVVATQNPTGTSTSFTNRPAGSYTIGVRSVAGAQQSAEVTTGFDLFLTPSSVPSVVATVDATPAMTVTWGVPSDTGGGIVDYLITVTPGGATRTVASGQPRTATFSGLGSGNYTVQVQARNDGGLSSGGTAQFSITVAPDAPRSVTATTGVRATTVSWNTPANNGNGTISAYEVTVGTQTKSVGAAVRSVAFTDVPLGSYTARVVAINAAGRSTAGISPEFRSIRPLQPFETSAGFARQVIPDLFRVPPTAADLSMSVTLATAPTVVTNLMRSPRFEAQRRVARLYFAYFGRVPDNAGQLYWADLLISGRLSIQGVSDEFAASREFQNTYGSLNEPEFVAVVYNNVLLRQPDLAGFNYWLQQRNAGLSRGGVMTWFTEGAEFIRLSLPAVDTSLGYITMLARSPSRGEFALWVNDITKNPAVDLSNLVAQIYGSDEYAARVTP
jgi:hypothetical protein